MKNKYNIPIIKDDIYVKKGNFIDYLTNPYNNNIIYKRRCISNDETIFIRYGIQITINEK